MAIPDELRIVGPGWSLQAERIELLDSGGWRALLGVRHGLKLVVAGSDADSDLGVEAWAGAPWESDGVAVIDAGDGIVRLARVPLCECGDRGCGNAGVQFGKRIAGDELPTLVCLLREFPWSEITPTRTNVHSEWRIGSDNGVGE